MAFPVVAEAIEGSTNSAGTNHVITHPTVVAGELWILILDKGSTSATVNAHALWTELLDEALANGLYIAYRWTDGTEGASSTIVTSASTRDAHITYRITGAENPATQAPQIGTTSAGTSATPDPPASAAPGATKDFLFITFYGAALEEADDDTWSDTPPTNFTPSPPRQKACGTAGTNLGGLIAAAERQLNTGVAQNPGTFAKDVSAAWRAQTIMVHPSSAPAPRRLYASFAEAEVPTAPRRLRASWAEMEAPTAPRRLRASFAEFEIPDVPVTDRRLHTSFAEMEIPTAPRRLITSWSEMEVGSAPRRLLVSFGELEVPAVASTAPPMLPLIGVG